MLRPEDEIILIDKPEGITSFDVIRRLRGVLKNRVMGHAGTLDPRASGLLIIAVGNAVNGISRYVKLSKTYRAEVLFGVETTTGDLDGVIIKQAPIGNISGDKVRTALRGMLGTLNLKVPAYSAIKIEGSRLYVLARNIEKQGKIAKEVLNLPVKPMEISSLKLLSFRKDAAAERARVTIDMDVGSGAYVRSIAEELGKRLGLPATLATLRRLSIGPFSVEQAVPLADLIASHAEKDKQNS